VVSILSFYLLRHPLIEQFSSGSQEFTLVDSSSSVQLLMTCLVKASPSFIADKPSSVAVNDSTWLNELPGP
jgi:hypothetical protein